MVGKMPNKSPRKRYLHFGTSSFSSTDWVGPFYPEGTKPAGFLKYYSGVFRSVEIDSTYYAVPSENTINGWRDKIPDNFIIAAKFPRSIVHAGKGSQPDTRHLLNPDLTYKRRDRFINLLSRLGKNLGPLLLQFPYFSKSAFAHKEIFFELLDRFLNDLPADFKYAVEIRNRHWLNKGFNDLCLKHKAALVMADQAWMPHGDEIGEIFDPVTADFSYIRLLGDRRKIEAITMKWEREVIDHTDRLKRWAEVLNRLAEREVETFIYANNHYAGHAPATVRRLQELTNNYGDQKQ
jgi:uncharacterized protein YecE (DUF72 family)